MNLEERRAKAQALRDQLREKRKTAEEQELGSRTVDAPVSGTGESASGVSESFDSTFGTAVQAPGGTASTTSSNIGDAFAVSRGNSDNRSGSKRLTEQSRQRNRRPDVSDGGSTAHQADGSETGGYRSAIGKLETDEEYSVRIDPEDEEAYFTAQRQGNGPVSSQKVYYKEDYSRVGRTKKYARIDNEADEIGIKEYDALPSRKENERKEREEREREQARQQEHKKRWYKYEGSTLSEEEAKSLLEPLKAVLLDDLTYLDQAIALKNPDFKDREIWGNLNEHEAETLAELWIKGGQKSPALATSVRVTVEVKSYAAALAILGPRIAMTAQALRTAPPRTRKPVRLFRVAEDEHAH